VIISFYFHQIVRIWLIGLDSLSMVLLVILDGVGAAGLALRRKAVATSKMGNMKIIF
jgi:hypothetical protein